MLANLDMRDDLIHKGATLAATPRYGCASSKRVYVATFTCWTNRLRRSVVSIVSLSKYRCRSRGPTGMMNAILRGAECDASRPSGAAG